MGADGTVDGAGSLPDNKRVQHLVVSGLVVATFLTTLVTSVGCPADPGAARDDTSEGEGEGEGERDDVVAGLTLLPRLAGLWTGPATSQTALGDFPIMSMDLRDVDGTTLFARGDLDDDNSIRFAFAVELHPPVDGAGADEPVLVFRNGGLFLGIARDSRARLIEVDDDAGVYRFCDVVRGCDYVDTTWTVGGDDLVLASTVLGRPHMRWEATRAEARPLPATYPADAVDGDAGFPPMATLAATVSFPSLAQDADLWLLLTTGPCGTSFDCTPSRSKRVPVAASASSVVVVVEQVHAGSYAANVILDRDRNMRETLVPTSGDGAARLDSDVVIVGTDDADATLPIVFTVP